MCQVLKVNPRKPERKIIKKAAKIIRNGGLVIFPTETVYGIAAVEGSKSKLNKAKKREKGRKYSIHIAWKKDIKKYVGCLDPSARNLIKKYWPGPLTLLIKDRNGKKTGFRMPDNKIALSLIRAVGMPIIAPSANYSGDPSPNDIRHVLKFSKKCSEISLILDGGSTKYKKDSTIMDLTTHPPCIIRMGCSKAVKAI